MGEVALADAEFRRGWRFVLGAFLGVAAGGSSTYFYTAGLFMKPMAAEFEWSRAIASLGVPVALLGYGFASPFLGMVIERHGAVRVGVLSLLALAAIFISLGAFTNGLTAFLLLMAAFSILACGSSPISFSRILIEHFDRQRGLALGLAVMGTGAGAIVLPISIGFVIESYGWRIGYFALAGVVLAVTPLVWLLMRGGAPNAEKADRGEVGFAAYASIDFWRLVLMFVLGALGVMGSIVHLAPMLTDRGMSGRSAAAIASVLGLAVIFGRVLTGWLLDRLPTGRLAAGLFVVSSLGLFALASQAAALVIPGAFLLGFAIGAEMDLMAYLVSRRFPTRAYGVVFGGLFASFSVGAAAGPLLAGYVRDASGDYVLWQTFAGCCLLAAAVVALTLGARPRAAEIVAA